MVLTTLRFTSMRGYSSEQSCNRIVEDMDHKPSMPPNSKFMSWRYISLSPQSAPGHTSHLDVKCDPRNDHIHKGILTPIILEKYRASRVGLSEEMNDLLEYSNYSNNIPIIPIKALSIPIFQWFWRFPVQKCPRLPKSLKYWNTQWFYWNN